jgi:subtilisin family serine protease
VGYALGISWDDAKPKPKTVAALVLGVLLSMVAGAAGPAAVQRAADGARSTVSVIVRRAPGSGTAADEQVRDLGGTIDRDLGIVDGFSATVPADAVPALRRSTAVLAATPNARGQALSTTYNPATDVGSMHTTTLINGIQEWWKKGLTGKGVTVALIDTGVTQVNGLRTSGKVIYGPDLSFESQASNLRHKDTYGHGTHMAGIIAGKDDAAYAPYTNSANFVGIAPDAKILSVKIGDSSGATDVSQMIAAIDWVVQHQHDNGMNVRVINLSFGTDTTQSYALDPLAHAAEVAWHDANIVVVAAVGNSTTLDRRINMPAADPYLIAVGALDTKGTSTVTDDTATSFTSVGNGTRNPDLLAAGKSIVSLRVPGSYADLKHQGTALAGTRFFRGSGTSQAAAVVSGAAALLLQQRSYLDQDEVKKILMTGASPLADTATSVQGAGALNMAKVLSVPTPDVWQTFRVSSGTGSLEASRGSSHLTHNGVELRGEKDIFGKTFNSAEHAAAAESWSAWYGGRWGWTGGFAGSTWSGSTWTGSTWSGSTWSGSTWSGSTWSSATYSSSTWTGSTWTGSTWTGTTWTGSTWNAATWTNTLWE